MTELEEKHAKFVSLEVDYFKHITTLSTGAIVILATFLEKLFATPTFKIAVVISLIGFILSVVLSTLSYTVRIYMVSYGETPVWVEETLNWFSLLMWISFIVGISSLAIFAIANLLK